MATELLYPNIMQVVHVMTKHPETIGPADSLLQAREMMDAGEFRRLIVVHHGQVVGILTDRDLRGHEGYLKSTRVDAIMKTKVVSVESKTSVETAARLILANKIEGMPVIDAGKLVGVITTTDLVRALLSVIETDLKVSAEKASLGN